VVPKLKGLTLPAARRKLAKAHCKLGKVKRPKARKGSQRRKLVVKRQSSKAGATLAANAAVKVTLGPAMKKTRAPKHP
jgi:beta-lactam-binding protein with PASTA domain